MSDKRRRQDTQHPRAAAGDKRPRRPRKHLYLVLDDWDRGFSIHKIGADGSGSDSDSDSDNDDRHLPDPPALRLEGPVARDPHTGMSFAALGTKIFVLMNRRCGLAYDAETAVLSIGAHAPAQMVCGFGVFLAVGEALYTLTYRLFDRQQPHSFQAMAWAPTAPEGWAWKTLPPPPFDGHVRAYALHPNGRTIFVTSKGDRGPMGTYSFDTKDYAWRSHGKWVLPFHGRGHFDGELDAWVGLDRDGYICCCRAVSPSFQSTDACFSVDCKMTKEMMFTDRHLKATLTYMGTSKFCLVECVEAKRPTYGAHDNCVVRLTMFGLKYNHKGDLQIKDHWSTRSFTVSRHRIYRFSPVAFWM